MVFIQGEQGVGKKTVASVLANSVRAAGGLAVVSTCARACTPFSVFDDFVSEALRWDRSVAAPALQDLARGLGQVTPDASRMTIGVSLFGSMAPPTSAAEVTEVSHRMWLFAKKMTSGRPFLWCFLDAHRLDEWTISATGYLGERLASDRGMLLLTHDDMGGPGLDRIRELQRDLAATRAIERLHLGRLTLASFERLLVTRMGFEPEAELIQRLYDHTSGNPLFLVELLDFLQDEVRESGGSERQVLSDEHFWRRVPGSVALLLEARLQNLDARTRRVLAVAAIEGSEFTADVISRVAQTHELDKRDIESSLEILQRQHALIRPSEGGGEARLERYRFTCDLVRNYLLGPDAGELTNAERSRLSEQIARCYVELYEIGTLEDESLIGEAFFKAGLPIEAASWFAAAAKRAVKSLELGSADKWAERAVVLLEPLRQQEPAAYLERLLDAAEIDYLLGQESESNEKVRRALEVADQAGDRAGAAEAKELMARQSFRRGDYRKAAAGFREVRETYEQLGDDEGVCRTLGREGACYEKAGSLDEATGVYRRELSTARIWGEGLAVTRAYKHLASASYEMGEFDVARDLVVKAQQSLATAPDPLEYARLSLLEGSIALAEHRFAEAEQPLREALATFEAMGYHSNVMRTLYALGSSLLWQNRLEESESVVRRALDAVSETNPVEYTRLLKLMGLALMRGGEFAESEEVLRRSLSVDEERGFEVATAEGRFLFGSLFGLMERQSEALEEYEKALEIYERLGDEFELAHVFARIGSIHRKKGDLRIAEECYRKSMRIARRIGSDLATARANRGLGKVALSKGDGDLAEDHLQAAAVAMRRYAGPVEVAGVLAPLGDALRTQEKFAEARAAYDEALALLSPEYNERLIGEIEASRTLLPEPA
jgi:tetratricopeptide (TPR) repeat protein